MIFKKIEIAKTIGNAFFLYSANIKFEIHQKKTWILKKIIIRATILCTVNKPYSNNAYQMFCSNSEIVRFRLSSRLRNGSFQPGITRAIRKCILLYIQQILNLKFTKNNMDTKKKLKFDVHFLVQ